MVNTLIPPSVAIRKSVSTDTDSWMYQAMSSQGDGTGQTDVNHAGTSVAAVTNVTPIVATATAHGYENGDYVWHEGHTSNTAANGLHKVANKADNTYELTDSAGNNVAGNGATDANGTTYPAFVCAPTVDTQLHRINLVAGDTKWLVAGYMNIAITNGLLLKLFDNTHAVKIDFTPIPITVHNMWGLLAGVDASVDAAGNNAVFNVRWTFHKGLGRPMTLEGSKGDLLALIQQDNLSGLNFQYAVVQGADLV